MAGTYLSAHWQRFSYPFLPFNHTSLCVFPFCYFLFLLPAPFSEFSSPVPYCQNCTFTKSCQTGCVTWYIVSKRKIKLYFRILFGVHYIELFLLSISIEKTSVIQYTSLIYFEFSCFKYLGQFLIRLLISPILFFFSFSFSDHIHGILKFHGQGLNLRSSCDLHHSCNSTRSFNPLCRDRDWTLTSTMTWAAA